MKYTYLKNIPLFHGIEESSLDSLMDCLGAKVKNYSKYEMVLVAGSKVDRVGIVVSGSVQVIKEDIIGNRTIIAGIGQYELFGEVFACALIEKSPITVVATEPCSVLWIQFLRLITTCSSACVFHAKLIENMLKLMAEKNIILNNKIDYLSKRTIREKLTAYIISLAEQQDSLEFEIPFNRNELADFLCVDRSAMSRELGKMRDEGLLDINKNSIKLLSKEDFLI